MAVFVDRHRVVDVVGRQGRAPPEAAARTFAAYRNWHRRRHNDDPPDRTPGVVFGLAERSLAIAELLAWRQDWRLRSVHPASASGGESVRRGAA
ncbi:MAG: hypothetical protein KDC98_09695 [Planctomycetes bacterium]|nr:hypothetical protein [Planctomycetota bacterium]